MYIYAVSGGERISRIVRNFKTLEVIPVQIYVKNILKKLINDKSYKFIFNYCDIYYYIQVDDDIVTDCHIFKDFREVEGFLGKLSEKNNLYTQSTLNIKGYTDIFIKFGDIYDEKILCK